jgi:Rod binding domain-containing protein
MEGVLPLGPDVSSLNFLPSLSAKVNPNANLDAAAQDFEAMFATQLLKPMFDTVPVDGAFGGGNGEQVMRTFMLQEYGKMIAKTGVLGLAPQVKAAMLRAQENAKSRQGAESTPFKAAQNYTAAEKTKGESRVASR